MTPRLIQAAQINLNTGTEPRSLSDIINFTQKSNLAESQLVPLSDNWEQALRTANRYFGTAPIYKEACTIFACRGGLPVPRDVETSIVTVGSGPVGLAVNSNTNRIYVDNYGAGTVSVIDGSTNTVTATITVGANPYGVSVNPSTNRIYVSDYSPGTVSVIDGSTNTVTATVPVGNGPYGVAVNSITNRVYVSNNSAGTVSVIDGSTNTVTATITVGAGPLGVSVNPSTNKVYVANNSANTVSVIDGSTNAVTATVTVGAGPYGVAVNASSNRIYVANIGSNSVSVIDGGTNTVTATVTVGSRPALIDVNPTTNRIYVSDNTGGTVSVVDGGTNSETARVTVGVFPYGVAVNSITNRAYVSNNGAPNSVSVIGQREELREACLTALSGNCLVVSSTGTLFPGTPQATAVSLVAVSLRSNSTSTGQRMAITIVCDNNTANASTQCSAFYTDGNVWDPSHVMTNGLTIVNAQSYFYFNFHWWDLTNQRIMTWSSWWFGANVSQNWYWGIYWYWRNYINNYGTGWLPWYWWGWYWMYMQYWNFWPVNFPT